MKKSPILLILLLLLIVGCQETNEETQKSDSTKTLSELQVEACNTADEAGTCDTRLAEVNIVLKEDCCTSLGKCC